MNRKFEDMREEIVEHLTQINNYQKQFGELLKEHRSYTEIAQKFSGDTGIDCSPQAGREDVQMAAMIFQARRRMICIAK